MWDVTKKHKHILIASLWMQVWSMMSKALVIDMLAVFMFQKAFEELKFAMQQMGAWWDWIHEMNISIPGIYRQHIKKSYTQHMLCTTKTQFISNDSVCSQPPYIPQYHVLGNHVYDNVTATATAAVSCRAAFTFVGDYKEVGPNYMYFIWILCCFLFAAPFSWIIVWWRSSWRNSHAVQTAGHKTFLNVKCLALLTMILVIGVMTN